MHNLINSTSALIPLAIAESFPYVTDGPTMTVLLGGAALLVIANQAITFMRSFRETPPPAQTYATKTELTKLESELREFNRQQEDRASKIHSRVDQVLAAVSRIEGVVEGQRKKS